MFSRLVRDIFAGAVLFVLTSNRHLVLNTAIELITTFGNSPTGILVDHSMRTAKVYFINKYGRPCFFLYSLYEINRCFGIATNPKEHSFFRNFAAVQGIFCSISIATQVAARLIPDPKIKQQLGIINLFSSTCYMATCGDGRFLLSQSLDSINDMIVYQLLADQIQAGTFSNINLLLDITRFLTKIGWNAAVINALKLKDLGILPVKLSSEVSKKIMKPPLPTIGPLYNILKFYDVFKVIYTPEALITAEELKEFWKSVALTGVFDAARTFRGK